MSSTTSITAATGSTSLPIAMARAISRSCARRLRIRRRGRSGFRCVAVCSSKAPTSSATSQWLSGAAPNGLRRLRVSPLAAGDAHYVDFPEAAYGVVLDEESRVLHECDSVHLFVADHSPDSVFEYDVAGARTRAEESAMTCSGGYEPVGCITSSGSMAPARDGALVPISLVYRAPLVRDGQRPAMLYAYGAYGRHIIEPTFSSARLSLPTADSSMRSPTCAADRIWGARGTTTERCRSKMNSFLDFIDCAEHLVRERYTSSDRLVAHGGSAGGLVMGAVANLRGDLFHAIVADVPFVDVINTMLDSSDPAHRAGVGAVGKSRGAGRVRSTCAVYSPYDNVRHGGAYAHGPAVHAQIFAVRQCAARRISADARHEQGERFARRILGTGEVGREAASIEDGFRMFYLLKMNMGAGHGGATGRYERLKEVAFRFAFMIDQTVA